MSVGGFDSTLGTKSGAAIATVAIAYDCPTTFKTYILFFHEALYIPTMRTHLGNPFQMRAHGVIIEDTPLQHLPADQRLPTSHTISVPSQQMSIPLTLKGTMSGFEVREPTWEEIEDQKDVIHVHMTGTQTWEPQDPLHEKQERALRKYHSQAFDLRVMEPREIYPLRVRGLISGDMLEEPMTVGDEDAVLAVNEDAEDLFAATAEEAEAQPMEDSVNEEEVEAPDLFQPMEELRNIQSAMKQTEKKGKCVTFASPIAEVMLYDQDASTDSPLLSLRHIASIGLIDHLVDEGSTADIDSFASALLIERGLDKKLRQLRDVSTTKKRSGFVTPEKLSKNWSIGLEAAKRTVEVTTQMAVRDFSDASGSRRLKPYASLLKWKRLAEDLYTDTMFAKCKSLRGNTCCQMYASPFHWLYARPMKKKSEAHYTLDELFSKFGVPRAIIPDNAKEVTEGDFLKKCRKAQCRVEQGFANTPQIQS